MPPVGGMLFGVAMNRPLNPEARAGLGAAIVLLSLVTAAELTDGPNANYIGLMATAPFLAAAFANLSRPLADEWLASTVPPLIRGRYIGRSALDSLVIERAP